MSVYSAAILVKLEQRRVQGDASYADMNFAAAIPVVWWATLTHYGALGGNTVSLFIWGSWARKTVALHLRAFRG